MFNHFFYTFFGILCLTLSISASENPTLTRSQSAIVCTGDSCSLQRPNPSNVVVGGGTNVPPKKLNKFTYTKARFGNAIQRNVHQIKRIGYLAEGFIHRHVGAIDMVDQAKAKIQKDKVIALKTSAQELKEAYKEQRKSKNQQLNQKFKLSRSSTFVGPSGMSENVFSPNRD